MKQSWFETTGFCHETSPSRCDSYSDKEASLQGCKLFKYKLSIRRGKGQLIGNADDTAAPYHLTSPVRMTYRGKMTNLPHRAAISMTVIPSLGKAPAQSCERHWMLHFTASHNVSYNFTGSTTPSWWQNAHQKGLYLQKKTSCKCYLA